MFIVNGDVEISRDYSIKITRLKVTKTHFQAAILNRFPSNFTRLLLKTLERLCCVPMLKVGSRKKFSIFLKNFAPPKKVFYGPFSNFF